MKKLLIILMTLGAFSNYSLAQCGIFSVNSGITVTCGDSAFIEVVGTTAGAVLTENFNSMTFSSDITLTQAAVYGNPCGPSLDGSPSLWMGSNGPAPRSLETIGYDFACGGIICFDLDYADDDLCGGCADCEDPDQGNEGVALQYSIDNGVSWIDIFFFDPLVGNGQSGIDYYSWENYCFDLPAGAWTANTKIRWAQLSNSGNGWDHWGIDNISIHALDCSPTPGYNYYWDGVLGDNDSTVWVNANTSYNILYTNGVDDSCQTTVDVIVDPFIAGVSYDNSFYCQSDTSLFPFGVGTAGGIFYSNSSLVVDSLTGEINPIVVSPGVYDVIHTNSGPLNCDSDTTQVEIITDDPSFSYGQTQFCTSISNTTPVITGDSGGTFTTISTLNLNSSTGTFNPHFTPPGNYDITYTPPTACSSLTINIEVVLSPTVDAGNDTTIFVGQSILLIADNPDLAIISWDGGVIDGVSFIPPIGTNIYTVTADNNGCVTTDQVVVTVLDNADLFESDSKSLSIYPNPSEGLFIISYEGIFNVEIFDAAGKLLHEDKGNNKLEINLEKLESGVYMIKLIAGQTILTDQVFLK